MVKNNITVKELHDSLQEAIAAGHGDTLVGFTYEYGDRGSTSVVMNVRDFFPEEVIVEVEHSDYLQMMRLADPDKMGVDSRDANASRMLVLEGSNHTYHNT